MESSNITTSPTSFTNSPYHYAPLPSPTSIRLVSLILHDLPSSSAEDSDSDSPSPLPPLHLCLRTVELNSASGPPKYHALSYTWSSPLTVFPSMAAREADGALHAKRIPVLCSTQTPSGPSIPSILLISPNLHSYLRAWEHMLRLFRPASAGSPLPHDLTAEEAASRVRRAKEAGLVPSDDMWIDAVCINQADVDEKSAQVTLMGRIYMSAMRVVVWLGPEDAFARPALSLLFRLSDAALSLAKAGRDATDEDEDEDADARDGGRTWDRVLRRRGLAATDGKHYKAPRSDVADQNRLCEEFGVPPVTDSRWWAVFALLERSWFRRAWVVQELALAGSAPATEDGTDARGTESVKAAEGSLQMQLGLLTFSWNLFTNAAGVLWRARLAGSIDTWAWMELAGPKMSAEPLWYEDHDPDVRRRGLDGSGIEPVLQVEDRPDSDRNLFTTLDRRRAGGAAGNVLALDSVRNGDGTRWKKSAGNSSVGGFQLMDTGVLNLMDECRRTQASDPRDKVYAFLEVAARADYANASANPMPSPHRRPLVPNYRLSTAQVYTEAAWYFLLTTRDLSLLGRTQFWPEDVVFDDENVRGRLEGLPTWVPDWRTNLPASPVFGVKGGKWAASGENSVWDVANEDDVSARTALYQPHLMVDGVYVGTIEAVQESFGEYGLSGAAAVAAALPAQYLWTSSPQTPGEVLWRTMTMDTLDKTYPIPASFNRIFYHGIWAERMRRAFREHHCDEGFADEEKGAEWQRFVHCGHKLFPNHLSGGIGRDEAEDTDDDEFEENQETGGELNIPPHTREMPMTEDGELISGVNDDSVEVSGEKGSIDELVALAEKNGAHSLSQLDQMVLNMWRGIEASLNKSKENEDAEGSKEEENHASESSSRDAASVKDDASSEPGPPNKQEEAQTRQQQPPARPHTRTHGRHRLSQRQQAQARELQSQIARMGNTRRVVRVDADDAGHKAVLETEPESDAAAGEAGAAVQMKTTHGSGTALLGNGPATAVVGDQVWLLFGANVPYVLRRAAPDVGLAGGVMGDAYHFVGDAYIHGGMHGELLKDCVGRQRDRKRLILL